MPEYDLESNREFYVHDGNCSRTSFYDANDNGLRACKECGGIFDSDGNGVSITDKRFDSWRQDG